MIGRNISHYKILERLGHGAMGIVYRGEDTHFAPSPDGKRVAVLSRDSLIRIYNLDGSRNRDIVLRDWEDGLLGTAWSANGERHYGPWGVAGMHAMLDISMDGTARAIWRTSDAPPANPLPSPDGKHLAFARARVERNAYLMDDLRAIWPDLARAP